MSNNKTLCYSILLSLFLLDTAKVQGGASNETSDPVIQRINNNEIKLRVFDENVLRAAASTSIQDCLCQCHWRTFRDRYGRHHGNCKSTDQTGGRWCYVRTIVNTYLGNHGYATCSDQQRSGRYPGMTWSYQACVTPGLKTEVCSYLLQNYRQTNNNHNYRNNIKPRIGENTNEGLFRDENGKIKKGNKWVKFPSVITLGGARPQPGGDREIENNSGPIEGDRLSSIGDSKDTNRDKETKTENKNVDDDAVHFG